MQTKIIALQEKSRLKRILRLLPCLLLLIIIFRFSSADAEESSQTSATLAESLVEMAHLRVSPEVLDAINGFVRKTAHFAEYALLAVLCFYGSTSWNIRPRYLRYLGVQGFCTLYAASDEIHQYFVPGRWCQLGDVILDSAGAAAGLLLCFLFIKLRGRKAQKGQL